MNLTNRLRRPLGRQSIPLDVLINIAFVLLVISSATRYLLSHGLGDRWLWVAALSAALVIAFAASLMVPTSATAGMTVVVLMLWVPLVWIAPSFWWCAFSLFFICRFRLRSPWSLLCIAGVAIMTGYGLMRLSGSFDLTVAIGILVVAVLVNSVFSRIEQDNDRQQRLIAELVEAQQQLAQSERRAGVLAERERLSHELHDTVTQGLTSSLLMMEAASQSLDETSVRAAHNIHIATEAVRANLAETRNLVHQLGSPKLDGISLIEAIRNLTNDLAGAECVVEGEPYALDADTTHAVLRVTQSALENVRRHAGASQTRVTLTYLPDHFGLDIRDDGVGFDSLATREPSAAGGYGLRAMAQRVAGLGGEFSVESAPGEGTAIAAHLPRTVEES